MTGGAGFIGSHILEKCSEVPGLSVTVLDNLSSGFKEYVPLSMNLVQMDVRDKALIDFLLQEKFDTVIHLAAQTLVPFSMEYPLVDADINIKGLINLLKAAARAVSSESSFHRVRPSMGIISIFPLRKRKSQRRLLSTVYPR